MINTQKKRFFFLWEREFEIKREEGEKRKNRSNKKKIRIIICPVSFNIVYLYYNDSSGHVLYDVSFSWILSTCPTDKSKRVDPQGD